MTDLDTVYIRAENIVSREIAGEVILVPIRDNVGDLESIYTLNETAASIWALLDGAHTLVQIRDAVIAEYETTLAEAEGDLLELVAQLEHVGAAQQVV
ncbi:MAG: PqqD family protein [Anaerolineae bacterium]|nr:PqqD family protein [Anaerolineae bacterium]